MTVIVKNVSGFMKIFIFLFGLYIISFGHSGPGGGFAGGVILATSYVLIMLAFGKEFVLENFPVSLALKLACIGTLAFVTLAIAGLFFGSNDFFVNFLHQKYPNLISSGNITIAEFFIGVIVASLVFLVIFSLSSFRADTEETKD